MSDVNISKYRAQVIRQGSTPASPGFVVSEGQNPVDPSGSGQTHLPVTIATVSTGLSITESQILSGAGLVSQYIRGDGSLADFPATTGGGSSVSYYLNGSVSQGTIGGVAYKQLNRTPVFGAGTDITINADGYIASFITDASDPNKLLIPAGNWNFETYFSASSSGGSPSFYVELYKYNGTTFTLIATSSSAPELIAFGTSLNPYFSTLAVPQTTLALTDRLALRYYVTHSGRTITLHTENNHLCQIITTFTTGLTALNGLTAQVQNFAVGTSGTDFAIASATATHTFNLPTASATNRGALSSADWTTFNGKQNALTNPVTGTGASGRVAYWNGTNSITSDSDLLFDGSNLTVGGNITIGSTQIIGINTVDGSDNGYLAICGASSDGPDRAGHIYLSGNERGTDAGSVVIAGGNTTSGTGATAAIVFRTLGTNKARLTSAGNFGIGTDTPVTFGTRNLDVNGGAGSAYIVARGFNNAGTVEMAFDGGGYIGTKTAHDLVIRTSDLQRINVFATSGNVLVGTGSDNGARLQVSGTATVTQLTTLSASGNAALFLKDASANNKWEIGHVSNSLYFYNYTTGTNPLVITGSTGAATFSSSVTAADLIISDTYANDPLIKLVTTTSGNVEVQMRTATTSFNAGIGVVTSGYDFSLFTNNTARLTIASTGAATFSSSIDARGNISMQYDGTAANQAILSHNGTSAILYSSGNITKKDFTIYRDGGVDAGLIIKGSNGNVLIGTTTDNGEKFQVSGKARFTSAPTLGDSQIQSYSNSGTNTSYGSLLIVSSTGKGGYLTVGDNSATTWYGGQASFITLAGTTGAGMKFRVDADDTKGITIPTSGNVGINTASPAVSLEVNGRYRTTASFSSSGTTVHEIYNASASGFGAYIAAGAGTNYSFRVADYLNNPLFTVNGNGNVGIGVTTPQSKLHIDGVLTFTESGFPTVRLNQIQSSHSDGSSPNNNLRFLVSDGSGTTAERMRINGSGKVLVNVSTVSPQGEQFAVTATNLAAMFKTTGGAANNWAANFWNNATSGNNLFIEFGTETSYAGRGSVTYNRGSGVVAYNTTSDYRIKTEIKDFNAFDIINNLKPKEFKIGDAKQKSIGFIAHELQEFFPQAVHGEKDAKDSNNKPIYQGVDYSQLTGLLVKAIQELKQEIDTVKN